jgi:hypothetical protein
MAANTIPDNHKRDAITGTSGGGGNPKRSDTLNGQPRTKSISGGSPNFSNVSPKDKSAPPPNNPYR